MCPADFYDLAGNEMSLSSGQLTLIMGEKTNFGAFMLQYATCFSDGTMARVKGLRILHVKAGYVLARLGG